MKVVRRLSAEAAYESLYGEDVPEAAAEEILERPIAFDPRFDLDDTTRLVIDDVSEALRHLGHPADLKGAVLAAHLGGALRDAPTIRDYLGVLRQVFDREAGG